MFVYKGPLVQPEGSPNMNTPKAPQQPLCLTVVVTEPRSLCRSGQITIL